MGGAGRFVSLLGPEGSGKTRLVAEFAREVHRQGALVLYGRCDHAHPDPLHLVDQVLRSVGARLDATVEAGTAGAEMGRRLEGWSAHWPIAVVLDDLHLASPETLEALAELASWTRALRVLVIGVFRAPAEQTEVGPSRIVLGPLADPQINAISALYADDWTRDELGTVRASSGGIPLLVHQHASDLARERAEHRVGAAIDRLADSRQSVAREESSVAAGVTELHYLLQQQRLHLRERRELAGEAQVAQLAQSPYRGLARFEAADAAYFHGRERLVAELAARAVGSRLVAVVGPSGSGKSSLVRAGLLPAFASGAVPDRQNSATLVMCPGPHPAADLQRVLRNADGDPVLFVDQFEETFTLCHDPVERSAFFDGLVTLLEERERALVVIALRADYLDRVAEHPGLASLVAGNEVLVGPLRDDELRRVVERPAQQAGLEIEPSLTDAVVADVAGQPGALPLVSTVLLETSGSAVGGAR